jgi:hypothetical protein
LVFTTTSVSAAIAELLDNAVDEVILNNLNHKTKSFELNCAIYSYV